jgi:hypothetical protein
VQSLQNNIDVEEKLYVISQLEKGEQFVEIWHKVWCTDIIIHRICDSADGIKESAECLDKVKWQQSETLRVCVARLPQT